MLTGPRLTFWDRPRLAAHNIARGDAEGTLTALVSPEQLSPDQMGISGDSGTVFAPGSNDPWSRVLRVISNPAVVTGALLAMPFPTSAKALLKWGGRLKAYSERLWPGVWRFGAAEELFRGTRFLRLMKRTEHDIYDFQKTVTSTWVKGVSEYQKATGRAPGLQTQIATAFKMDGLDNPDNPTWKFWRDWLKRQSPEAFGISQQELDQIVKGLGRGTNISMVDSMADPRLAAAGREAMEVAWTKMFSGGNYERLIKRRTEMILSKVRKKYASNPELLEKKLAESRARLESGEDLLKNLSALGIMFNLPAKVMGDPKKSAAVIAHIRKALETGKFQYVAQYFPHITSNKPGELSKMLHELLRMTPGGRRSQMLRGVEPVSKHLETRSHGILPSLRDLEMIQDALSPETRRAIELSKAHLERLATMFSEARDPEAAAALAAILPRQYSLRLSAVIEQYSHGMSRTYAWTARGWGPKLKQEAAILAATDKQGIKSRIAQDTYLPLLMGRLTPDETMHALAWSDRKAQAADFLGKIAADPRYGSMAQGAAKKMLEWLATPAVQDVTWKNAGAKIASMLYLNTLGLNMSSAALNITQNLLTTSMLVEGKYLLRGLGAVLKDSEKFISAIQAGKKVEDAFEMAFPYYSKYLGTPSEVETMTLLRQAAAGGGTWRSKAEKVKSIMMATFTGSERFNKLWAFQAGRAKALGEGLKESAANLVGQRVVEATQFPGGILSTPYQFLGIWPPLQQFTRFPLRTVGLAAMSPGTFGRALMTGGVIYGIGRELGDVDLSRGLLFGAAPIPDNPDAPFYPLPVMPPLLQAAGSAAMSVLEGDSRYVRRTLPLIIPGGVALSRVASTAFPEVGQALSREYADYENMQADGRIPIMSADGALKGFKTPIQMWASALGWTSMTGDSEAELIRYLVAQRDKLRAFRKEYIEALAANDFDLANRIDARFRKQYPRLGGIQVKAQDINAVRTRHTVARVERVLNTMPPEVRGEFGQMIGVAMADRAEQFLGVDPALLQSGTALSRNPYRNVTYSGADRLGGILAAQTPEDRPAAGTLRPDQFGQQPKTVFDSFRLDGF